MSMSITVTSLSFAWPDGTAVFEGLDTAFGPGRTGLVGVNGSGKSTLLKLIAGDLAPADGTVRVAGEIGYLPQNVTLDTALRVDEALGIAAQRAALHAIEAGDAAEEHFETIGDDWDVEERALATLGELGLGHIELDRGIGEVSGGESVLLRLAALLLQPAGRAAARRADQQPRPLRPQAAVRGRRRLARGDGRGQPRP